MIARDRRWCVLSEDRGSHSSRQDALPFICFEYEVTLIRISHPVIARGLTVYGPQLLANWPSIVEATRGPKGAQYLLRWRGRSSGAVVVVTKPPKGFDIVDGKLAKNTDR